MEADPESWRSLRVHVHHAVVEPRRGIEEVLTKIVEADHEIMVMGNC